MNQSVTSKKKPAVNISTNDATIDFALEECSTYQGVHGGLHAGERGVGGGRAAGRPRGGPHDGDGVTPAGGVQLHGGRQAGFGLGATAWQGWSHHVCCPRHWGKGEVGP